jgi:hypothetical protein
MPGRFVLTPTHTHGDHTQSARSLCSCQARTARHTFVGMEDPTEKTQAADEQPARPNPDDGKPIHSYFPAPVLDDAGGQKVEATPGGEPQKRTLPEGMRSHLFQKGEVRNPGGRPKNPWPGFMLEDSGAKDASGKLLVDEQGKPLTRARTLMRATFNAACQPNGFKDRELIYNRWLGKLKEKVEITQPQAPVAIPFDDLMSVEVAEKLQARMAEALRTCSPNLMADVEAELFS